MLSGHRVVERRFDDAPMSVGAVWRLVVAGLRRQGEQEGTANLRVHLIGPHPIRWHFLGRMNFSRIVCQGWCSKAPMSAYS